MKRWILVLITAALVLSGCSGGAKEPKTPEVGDEKSSMDGYQVVSCNVGTTGGNILSGALNGDKMAISAVQHLPIYKIASAQELRSFIDSYGAYFAADRTKDDYPSFEQVISNKDDAFFAEQDLLLVVISASSGSFRYGVNSIGCEAGTLTVEVGITNNPQNVTMDLTGWFVIVSIPKATTDQCSEFDAYLNHTI